MSLLAYAGATVGDAGIQMRKCYTSCMPVDKLHFGLIFVSFLLLTGAQVQLQPPVQGLVPYGDDD